MELVALAVSVGGVIAIVLVCWLAGGTRKTVIASADQALEMLSCDEPTFQAARVLVAGDRRTALVANDSGTDIAAVMVFGDKFVTRRFGHGSIRSVALRQEPAGGVMTVLTDDPTCRRIEVVIGKDGPNAAESRPGPPETFETDNIEFWLSAMERLRQGAQRADHRARAEEA